MFRIRGFCLILAIAINVGQAFGKQLAPSPGKPLPDLGSPTTTVCENGRLTLSQKCRQIEGLQAYLNRTDIDAELPRWLAKESELVRECMKGVRLHNMKLKDSSKSWCPLADDRAFKILTELNNAEVREFQARDKFKGDADRITFEDNQCFGSICYQRPYRNIYNPLRDQGASR